MKRSLHPGTILYLLVLLSLWYTTTQGFSVSSSTTTASSFPSNRNHEDTTTDTSSKSTTTTTTAATSSKSYKNPLKPKALNHKRNTLNSKEEFSVWFHHLLYQGKLDEAEELLLLQKEGMEYFEPTLAQRTMLMNAFVKQGKVDRAYANFARMKSPDVTAFNSIIFGLASFDEAEKAEILLRRMEEQSFRSKSGNASDEPLIMPNEFSYKPVLHAHLHSSSSNGIEKSLALLYRMEDFHARGIHDFKPELDLYNMVLNAMGKRRDGNGAIQLLEHMIRGVYTPRPNEVSFNCAINAQTNDTKAAALLARMEELNASNNVGSNVPQVKPNSFTFGALIDVYARRRLPLKAESVLQYMNEQYVATDSDNFKANTIHFNSVIDAWVRSKDTQAGVRAEHILKQMLESDDPRARPDLLTFNMVMRALGSAGAAKSTQKSEELLLQLESGHFGSQIKPNNKSYNIVINNWSKCKEKGSARRAELIFERLQRIYENEDRIDLKPDVYSYTSLIDAFSKVGASRRAEDVMLVMKQNGVKPNVYTYNTVISSWARSGDASAPKEAERVIRNMLKAGVKPNSSSYTALMDVYSKSRNQDEDDVCHRVEEILHLLEEKAKDGDEDMQPSVWSYTTVINAFAKSNEKLKALKARSILNRMNPGNKADGFVEPNIFTYNAVLNACAYSYGDSEERSNVFKIATRTFNELLQSKHCNPDSITYGTFLRCCNRLIPEGEERDQIVENIFHRSCKENKVSEFVYNQLRDVTSDKLYQQLRRWETLQATNTQTPVES